MGGRLQRLRDCPTRRRAFRSYYRGNPVAGRDGSETEVTCYAESREGINFTKPVLGLFEVHGTRSNNVVTRRPVAVLA